MVGIFLFCIIQAIIYYDLIGTSAPSLMASTTEGSNKVDLNTYENTSRVKIKKNSLKTSKGFLILPPHSISVVLFNI